jgi:hypothetical protein
METAKLLLLLLAHLGLTALPGVAAALFSARVGVRQAPVLLAIFLAASGTVGMLAFWSYFAGHLWGEAFAYFAVLGSLLLGGVSLRSAAARSALGALVTPLALWGLASAFLLLFGFVHGGTDIPLATSATRFSHPLPGDNYLPLAFADWIFENGHSGHPPIQPGEWHLSDRPPLQSGYVVMQRTFGWDSADLNYQVLGVALQQLWVVGLWALLSAANVGRVSRALVLTATLVSALVIVNGFFVWPKLLPAAMLLAVAALVMTPLWSRMRTSIWGAVLIATLCGLAMLGHGSSVFGILPLIFFAIYRGLPSWRWIGAGVLVGVAFMAPWSAYQRYEDPPGNRLLKWTLAGVVDIDSRGVLETIQDSYAEDGVEGALHHKAQNFVTMIGGGPAAQILDTAFDSGDIEEVVRALRFVAFLYLVPSLGLLVAGPVAMVLGRGRARRRPAEWSFALTSLVVVGAGAVAWDLIVYGDQDLRTVVHVSSYLLPILLMAACVVGLRAAFPRFAIYWVAASAALTLALFFPSFEPPLGSAFSPLAAACAALSLAGFVYVALRTGRGDAATRRERETAGAKPTVVGA